MKQKTKKNIAREIIIFFSTVLLISLILGFIALRNFYYNNRQASLKEKCSSLTTQLDSLPKDHIKALYDGLCLDFYIDYGVGEDIVAIPNRHVKEFLNAYPSAKLQKKHKCGYSYIKAPDSLKISGIDSTIIFDFVTFGKFEEFLLFKDYRNKLFLTFSDKYDMGSRPSFDSKVQIGLKFSKVIESKKAELITKKELTAESLNNAFSNILDKHDIQYTLFWITMFLIITIYPARIMFILIRWAFTTIKEPKNK